MKFKIGKDTNVITIVREEEVLTNSSTIQKGAFGGFLEDIKEIIIPEGITSIEENAFKGCTNLTTVILPGSLKHIGRNAFVDCKSLKTTVLPESISAIECWGERRAWKIDLNKPFTDLAQYLIKGLEVELNPPVNWK